MTVCRGICNKIKVRRPNNTSPYVMGLKQCNYCKVFLEFKGKLCPCCNTNLRRNPRTKSQKEKLRKMISKKNIKKEILKSMIPVASLSVISGVCVNHGLQHMFHSISNIF